MEFISYAQLAKDVEDFCKRLPKPALIVGIPRSGMIPATMMAKYWNVPLRSTDDEDLRVDLFGNTYIVDDSMLRGQTMKELMNTIGDKVKYLFIYGSELKKEEGLGDYTGYRKIIGERVFQWNLWQHKEMLIQSCIDIDGVLCRPPTPKENDDGPLYENFLAETEPWFRPTEKIGALVTARLIKYKEQTVDWLHKHNIKFKHLVMLNMKSKAERLSYANVHSRYKADIYKATKARLFIEDEPNQAKNINQITGKPVLCVSNWTLYNEVKK